MTLTARKAYNPPGSTLDRWSIVRDGLVVDRTVADHDSHAGLILRSETGLAYKPSGLLDPSTANPVVQL